MKPIVIEEYRAATSTSKHYANSLSLTINKLVKEFVGNDYEAVEITDEDIGREKGYLNYITPSAQKNNKKSYGNGSYIANIFRNQIKALNLEDMVQVTHSKGHVYLARKELL